MKIVLSSLVALLGGVGRSNAFLVERDLQNCPSPIENVACPAILAPVKCSLNACAYDNLCIAGAAGFGPSRCWPDTCTTPAADAVCTREMMPVLCGDLQCPFDNSCLANAAGFPPTTCSSSNCPTGATEGAICPANFDPFVCFDGTGICTYSNACLVGLAGFDADLSAGQCVRIVEFPANRSPCPVVPEGTACTFDYNPQICGPDQCFYSNSCEATAAGATECQSANCPEPAGDVMCTMEFLPVICDPEGCEYSNQCLANAAGHDPASCRLASCPVPDPTTPCTFEYNPQTCTGDCKYANPCIAAAAGVDVDTECTSDADPTNPDDCPTPPADTACTLDINEKKCGEDGCYFSNQCLADAAGFSQGTCWTANCPQPSTVSDCGSDSDPQVCGPFDCTYGNRCLANRAGWSPSACSPVSCPAVPADTICPLLYAPIVCNSDLVASGITCAFSNDCEAQAAGYTTDYFAGQCVRPYLLEPKATAVGDGNITDDAQGGAGGSAINTPGQSPGDIGAEDGEEGSVMSTSGAASHGVNVISFIVYGVTLACAVVMM